MTTLLDRIRAAELEAAQRIETAREQAAARLAAARSEADEMIRTMRDDGRALASAGYERAIGDARGRAAEIETEPDEVIARLRREVEPYLDELAGAMLELILAPPAETGV